MGSELERCYDDIIIYFNMLKALKKAIEKWWVDPFEG